MKFSVIIPVYNSDKYLEKCITSVINQTYSNWELIIVDDGSTDNSLKIINEYADNDDRIKPIHIENSGPGNARNLGIKEATGDYVVFLDSDDYIDNDYFSLLVPKAEKADVVFIDILQVSCDGKILNKEFMSNFKNWSKDRILRSQMTGKIPWGGVRKTVRRSIIIDNDIKYTNHKVGEEALYSFRVVHASKKIDFIDEKPVYYYVNHEGSQSKISVEDPWGEVVHNISEYLKENNLYNEFEDTINAFAITALVISLDRINLKYHKKLKREVIKTRIDKYKENYCINKKIDELNIDYKVKILIPFIRRGIYSPIIIASWFKNIAKKLTIEKGDIK